jgi:hypothetical protein
MKLGLKGCVIAARLMSGLSGVRPPLFASWLVYKLASASQIINLFLPFLTSLLALLDYRAFAFISLISFVTRSYINAVLWPRGSRLVS